MMEQVKRLNDKEDLVCDGRRELAHGASRRCSTWIVRTDRKLRPYRGALTSTRVPPPEPCVIVQLPPNSSARSRMVAKPSPDGTSAGIPWPSSATTRT